MTTTRPARNFPGPPRPPGPPHPSPAPPCPSSAALQLPRGGLLSHLPHDAGRNRVLTQAKESGMPQLPAARPLGETHLGDQHGFDPVHAGTRWPAVARARQQVAIEGRVAALELA